MVQLAWRSTSGTDRRSRKLAAGATVLLLALPLDAQPTQPATQPAASAPAVVNDVLTIERVRARIAEVEAATDIDADERKRVTDVLQQALARLTEAAGLETKAAAFDKQRIDAPGLLEQLQKSLQSPPPAAPPDPPADAALAQLEQLRSEVERAYEQARTVAADLDKARPERQARRIAIPAEIAESRRQLDAINQELSALNAGPPPVGESSHMTRARRFQLIARRRLVQDQIECAQAELAFYEATGDLLTAQRDQAARDLAAIERRRAAVDERVNARRQRDAEEQARQAQLAMEDAVRAHPALTELAKEVKALADERRELADRIQSASRGFETVDDGLTLARREYDRIQGYVDAAGLTHEIGQALLQQRAKLASVRDTRRDMNRNQRELSRALLRQLKLDDARDALRDTTNELAELTAAPQPVASPHRQERIVAAASDLLARKREFIEALYKDYGAYAVRLRDLTARQFELAEASARFAAYVDRNVLWIRSGDALWDVSPTDALNRLRSRYGAIQRGTLLAAVRRDVTENPVAWSLAAAGLVILAVSRRTLLRRLSLIGEAAACVNTDRFGLTVRALVLSVLAAAVWPAAIWLPGWRLSATSESAADPSVVPDGAGGNLIQSVGVALQVAAAFYFALTLILVITRHKGLGPAHFRWRKNNLDIIRRMIRRVFVPVLLLALGVAMVDWQTADSGAVWIGRVALIAGLLIQAHCSHRLLSARRPFMADLLARYPGGWLARLRRFWHALFVLTPIGLALLVLIGYSYTAVALEIRVLCSIGLLLAVILLHFMLVRWLYVAHRRLAYDAAVRKREADAAAAGAAAAGAEAPPIEVDDDALDLALMSQQARGLLRSVSVLALGVGVFLIWRDVLPALARLDSVPLWTKLARDAQGIERPMPVSLSDAALAVVAGLMTFVAAKNLPGVLEITILQRLPLEPGARYAVTTISRYLITILGAGLCFDLIGVGWSKVQWLAAALTFGLGFGLQEIFANFISGLILLFERPIRVGDTVTVAGVTGVVTRIRTRATTILDWDRKELIVPNKEFITSQVVNWTLTDSVLRLVIPVGIAYGSDTALARQILLKLARGLPSVLSTPEPQALFQGFGDSALNFELRVFIRHIDELLGARHQLHMDIDAAFREAGIEIAFPQRDVHIRTVNGDAGAGPELRVALRAADGPTSIAGG